MKNRRDFWTLLVYLGILVFIAIFGIYASRYVIHRPWTARNWAAVVCAGNEIYALGGANQEGELLDEVLRIDPASRKARVFSHLLSPRYGIAAVGLDGSVFCLGGDDKSGYRDQIIRIDLKTGVARIIGRLPTPRAFGGAASILGKIYYIGGWDGKTRLGDIVRVDPISGESQIIGYLPSPREFLAVAAADGKLYAIGGEDNSRAPMNEIVEIDPTTGKVLRTGSLPGPRERSAAVGYGDKIYVFGGWGKGILREIVEIAPSFPDLSGTVIGSLPPGRADLGAAACAGEIYLIGGSDPTFHQQIGVLKFDPRTRTMNYVKLRHFLWW